VKIRFALLSLLGLSFAASALPQRTFVASNGSDDNPCSLTSPCRSLGTAVGAVADGGEVLVLDSAGYGPVTITKSVSIIAPPGVYAGISAATADGVTVDGASIDVVLRGLTINGIGATTGIAFQQGSSVHVENCVVSGFTSGTGIHVAASSSALHVVDTIVRGNQNGIVFGSTGSATLSRVRVERNTFEGVQVTGQTFVAIEDSVVAGSSVNIDVYPLSSGASPRVSVARTLVSGGLYGIYAYPNAASASAVVAVMDSTITQSSTAGIAVLEGTGVAVATAVRNQLQGNQAALVANGAGATLILDGNAIEANVVGISRVNNATIASRNNNTVSNNATDTVGTPFTPLGGI
jgi:hypothetical protein